MPWLEMMLMASSGKDDIVRHRMMANGVAVPSALRGLRRRASSQCAWPICVRSSCDHPDDHRRWRLFNHDPDPDQTGNMSRNNVMTINRNYDFASVAKF